MLMDARIFAALADPTRRDLLMNLAENSPKTATQLAEEYPITRQGILKHLHILEDAGLVAHRVEGTKRPRRLAKAGIDAMDQWLAMLRKAIEKNYDRLDQVLSGMEQPKTK